MNVFEMDYKIRSVDVDPRRELRPSHLLELMQEAATAHAAALGVGRERGDEKGFLWVVTTQKVRVARMPRYGEEVTLATWAGPAKHVLFPRFCRLRDKGGHLLAEASSLWVLMDPVSRKMLAPEDCGVRLDGAVTGEEMDLPTPPKMGAFTGESVFTVPYSYIDMNGHMNNTRYLDLGQDLTPDDLRRRPLREATIKYGAEALLGERLELKTGREENAFFLLGESGDKKVFRLRMEYGA